MRDEQRTAAGYSRRVMRCAAISMLLLGCSPASPSASPSADVEVDAGPALQEIEFGGDRPVTVRAPAGADPKVARPLVVVLHAMGATGFLQSIYFRLDKLVDEKNFLLLAPDGMINASGTRFWAAADGCCTSGGKVVDDVKYLTGLVDEVAKVWTIDRKRVFLAGHSNGGAMEYRLACEPNQPFAAAFMLAPAFFAEHTTCAPTQPISIRHVHGSDDGTVKYNGGALSLLGPTLNYLAAPAAVALFAQLNGCGATPDTSAAPIDLDLDAPGAETTVARYTGCNGGVSTEFLTMQGGRHFPGNLTTDIGRSIWSWLEAHPRP
jgi:polyhydroxybutyrate depolymerase